MSRTPDVKGLDIPITQLQPLNERRPPARSFKRLVASIREIGLIEPLCVYKEHERFVILDGYLRYLACLELAIESVPCLIYKTKEAYSFNKMVNRLSPIQENRMIKRSLEMLDAKTIARALGLTSLGERVSKKFLANVTPAIAKAFDSGQINHACLQCMNYVKPERQDAILKEMLKAGDFTPAFARAMVIRTPRQLRAKLAPNRKSPWRHEGQKQEMIQRLNEVEKRYDFYTGLYRQYVSDLLKLCIYIRKLVTNDRVRAFINKRHPEILQLFNDILFETGEVGPVSRKKVG